MHEQYGIKSHWVSYISVYWHSTESDKKRKVLQFFSKVHFSLQISIDSERYISLCFERHFFITSDWYMYLHPLTFITNCASFMKWRQHWSAIKYLLSLQGNVRCYLWTSMAAHWTVYERLILSLSLSPNLCKNISSWF